MAADRSVLEEDEEDRDAASPKHEYIDLEALGLNIQSALCDSKPYVAP